MYSLSELPATHQNSSAKFSKNAPSSNPSYAFLSSPPKHKHKPQPISTRCSPPRSLPRSISTRRRSSISGSPSFQVSFIVLTPTPTSDSPKTPHLTSHGCTAAFATFPRRRSVSHVQEGHFHLAHRVLISPKRSPNSGSPKRSHSRSPSSPTRTRTRAKSITRIPLPTPPPPFTPRTSTLSKIRSLTNLRGHSPSPVPLLYTYSTKSTMTSAAITTPKVTSKRAKHSATPSRGSAAFAKYRPMPFIQQMQMIQFLEGGTLDSHIRRHHVHAGQGTAHTGFATGGKEDIVHGYSFTDERGMIWFDEEEEWEFTPLLHRAHPQRRRGIKRLLGKRRDAESGDEWEDFVEEEEEELGDELDPEVLLAGRDHDLRVRDNDLASFGGALEGPWAKGHSGSSVLKLPRSKTDHKSKRSHGDMTPLPEPVPASAHFLRERVAALKEEFLATSFTPSLARTSPSLAPSRPTSPFRSVSRALFQRHHRAARSVPNANAPAGGHSFSHMGSSSRGGEVLDSTKTHYASPSPTVEWASVEDQPLPQRSTLAPATEALLRTPSPLLRSETRLRSVTVQPAVTRRLAVESSTEVSLQPFTDTTMKQKFRFEKFKSTKAD